MSLRLGALFCLAGLAACSHEKPRTADDSTYTSGTSTPPDDPSMTPASLEDRSASPTEEGKRPRSSPATAGNTTTTSTTPPAEPPGTNEPAAGTNAAPDNTKVNERDRNDAAKTPLDQQENERDLKITQQIRQAVMADKSLSFTAKNVKIITANGKVTLRGPVNTEQERSSIEAAARKVAGITHVDNQIEVKK